MTASEAGDDLPPGVEPLDIDEPPAGPTDRLRGLWSPWRFANPPGLGSDGRPHANLPPDERTMFERIVQSDVPETETYIVHRGEHCFVLLNVFPYTVGHTMVLPNRGVPSIAELDDAEYTELWDLVRDTSAALRSALRPHGLNIGINEGEAGGGSVPDHLHVHVLPRWNADTNFMTTVAGLRILPMSLGDLWTRLRDNWPR